jgi:DNA sulfur modification protein DndC
MAKVTDEKAYSIFDTRTTEEIHQEIQQVYLGDSRPWVVGYSGGKDSTTALQLVWYALEELPPEQRQKPVYVITSDTLVETPVIVNYITGTLGNIEQRAKETGMPFRTQVVTPEIDQTFWVNLIGKGYPAPYTKFRWCTDRMKIQPANQFILDKVSEHGEVILILGVRKGESTTRDQVLSLHKIKDSLLSRHTSLSNAFVYTPIVDFSLNDVWIYLFQVPSPWGNDNKELFALYRNANAGECPLVVDETTPSCGNSRFGCWTCTVVSKDKSMEAMIDNGEDWMMPMLEFRDFLASTQELETKKRYREHRRRGGFIQERDGKLIRGPYKLEFCKQLLRKLLETQQQVRQEGPEPDIELITPAELEEIRKIWRTERQDWEDSVPQIYQEVIGEGLNWITDDLGTFTASDKAILESLCNDAGIPVELVAKLLDTERQFYGMNRRASIYDRINAIFHEDWRSEETVIAELEMIREKSEVLYSVENTNP